MSSDWICGVHGVVAPLAVPHPPSAAWLRNVAARSTVPVWLPWPLPPGWLLTGVAEAGHPRSGPTATVVACSGPNPAPHPSAPHERPADLLVVAEALGVGLGAHLAGLDDVDPGDAVAAGPPHAKVRAGGHLTSLWPVDGAQDRSAFVGESGGVWLWLLLWPASAEVLLLERLELVDVRDGGRLLDPPTGAASQRLT
jgi:hypothetical protein